MLAYYNTQILENEISYQPYWYEKSNFIIDLVLAVSIIIIGGIVSNTTTFKNGLIIALLVSTYFFLTGFYKLLIQNKTTLIFDKTNDALYKITPLRKTKIGSLSKAIDITSKAGSAYYSYFLNIKIKNKTKKIRLTTKIKNKKQNNPEVRFLEIRLIPELELFLNLNKNKTVFDLNNCSSI
ncbi:hypothetical protein [Flavobacterium sp. KACC 22761]|uniref:hypothetical protein n=1 Tax=Flavobacterium sp. KACC 22761 TaxID=3092665 RepID=UPI002A764AF8|nr:hypothetical protein [Flavobacterium sp. KACC 22761]WPO76876.1 hypothetical protein SCB73_11395 [Flavobacterium sp. KACC 22761]